jgi:hypothetical protein
MKGVLITINLLLLMFLNSSIYADNRFMPPDINMAHTEMQIRLENDQPPFNSNYIRSYVAGLISKKIRESKEDSDLTLFDNIQQTDGNNLINSIIVEPGAEVEGDIFIIGSDNGDITLIDTD